MTTKLYNAVSSLDEKVLAPFIKNPCRDLVGAATLKMKVSDDGQRLVPDLDVHGEQKGFHPYGAMVVTACIAMVIFKVTEMVCNMVVPYNIRSHVLLGTKLALGACVFHLFGIALNSIREQSKGEPARPGCCG